MLFFAGEALSAVFIVIRLRAELFNKVNSSAICSYYLNAFRKFRFVFSSVNPRIHSRFRCEYHYLLNLYYLVCGMASFLTVIMPEHPKPAYAPPYGVPRINCGFDAGFAPVFGSRFIAHFEV